MGTVASVSHCVARGRSLPIVAMVVSVGVSSSGHMAIVVVDTIAAKVE